VGCDCYEYRINSAAGQISCSILYLPQNKIKKGSTLSPAGGGSISNTWIFQLGVDFELAIQSTPIRLFI